MTVTTDSIDDVYLRKRLPLNLDPLTVNTISEFCGVERDYIFYLVAENDSKITCNTKTILYNIDPLKSQFYIEN